MKTKKYLDKAICNSCLELVDKKLLSFFKFKHLQDTQLCPKCLSVHVQHMAKMQMAGL